MIVPFEDIVSTPIAQEGHFQYCVYETSDDKTTFPICERTWFPNPFDFQNTIRVDYSVFYKRVNDENAELHDNIKGMKSIHINGEPYFNEETRECDIFASFVDFDEIEDAYNYAISKEVE